MRLFKNQTRPKIKIRDLKMQIAFMGSPEISAIIFNDLVSAGLKIESIITQPDRPCGRGCQIKESPLKTEARKHQTKIYEPRNKESLVEVINNIRPDLCIVAAYGMIIPKEALNVPKYGMINFHPSLLPLYRGPSPIAAPILNGDKETGVTIIQITEKLDAGDIIMQEKIRLGGTETTLTLSESLAHIGSKMIIDLLPKIEGEKINKTKQNESQATYTKILKKEDGLINWKSQSAKEIERMSRAYRPWPGVYTNWNGKKIDFFDILIANENLKPGSVLEINNQLLIGACDGAIVPRGIKIEGKKRVTPREFLCGYPSFTNFQLNS